MNVADGTYNECNISMSNSGSAGSPITFQAQNKWGAKVLAPITCDTMFNLTGSYIVIKNLDISGAGARSSVGIWMNTGSNHTAFGNKIHNIGNTVQNNLNGNVGIFVSTPNDVIDSNMIFGIGRLPGSNTLTHDHGMYVDGASGAANTIIQNNLFYQNTAGYNIQLFPGNLSGVSIVNNTIDATGSNVTGCIVQGTNLSNSRISNNICTNPGGGIMIHDDPAFSSASNVLIDHNVISVGTVVESNNGYTVDSSNVLNASASAMYKNFGANDFSLSANSPALGIATGATAPPVDIIGTPRPQNGRFDAGAYEFPN